MLITSLFTGIAAGTLAAVAMLATGQGLLWAAAAYTGSGVIAVMLGAVLSVIGSPFRSQAAPGQTVTH